MECTPCRFLGSHRRAVSSIANTQSQQVASTKLAVEGQVKELEVSKVAGDWEPHTNGPNLPEPQRSLRQEMSISDYMKIVTYRAALP